MARTTQSMKHTHKYYRIESTGLWHCVNCTHYMPGNMPPPVGRMSLCWMCDGEFQLTPYNMEDSRPMCDECRGESEQTREKEYPVFNIEEYQAEMTRKRRQAIAEGHDKDCEAYLGGECKCTIVQPDEIEVYDPDENCS